MCPDESQDQLEKKQLRPKTIHLPSVDPDCYIAVHTLELGNFLNRISDLSEPKNWNDLRQILQPVADLVVKDAIGQYFVDDVRRLFDSVRVCYSADDAQYPFMSDVMWQLKSGDVEVLRMLLAVGLDPDLPDSETQMSPSHECGFLARADLAELIFPCRPCMTALTACGKTPLQVASQDHWQEDDEFPQRRVRRKEVRNYIKNGGFETRFPTLVELAVREQWFAIKNLLRRGVVAEAEYTELLEGKTAAEWAEFYGEACVAKEIHYYAADSSTWHEETSKQMAAMVEKLCDKEDEASALFMENLQLKQQLEKLEEEVVAKDAKNEQLSEALAVLRKRFEKA